MNINPRLSASKKLRRNPGRQASEKDTKTEKVNARENITKREGKADLNALIETCIRRFAWSSYKAVWCTTCPPTIQLTYGRKIQVCRRTLLERTPVKRAHSIAGYRN